MASLLAQLDVSEDITSASHRTVSDNFSGIAELLERSRADGPIKDAPLGFVLTLTSAITKATIDAMIRKPVEADAHARVGFEAMWRGDYRALERAVAREVFAALTGHFEVPQYGDLRPVRRAKENPHHRRERHQLWPARIGVIELGRRRDDSFAAAYRTWLNAA